MTTTTEPETRPATHALAHDALQRWGAPGSVPDFAAIRAEEVGAVMRATLAVSEAALAAMEAEAEALTAPALLARMEALDDRLGWVWGLVNHLNSVRTSDALRAALAEVQPEVVTFQSRLGQSKSVFAALTRVAGDSGFAALAPAAQRAVTLALRGARHSGVGLVGAARERFNQIMQELAQRGMDFANAVVDATKAWSLLLTAEEDVAGLPPSLLALLAQQARAAGSEDATPEAGPWRVTLDGPVALPFLEWSARRDLREVVYRAWIGRAGPAGDPAFDNEARIGEILALRAEQAQLLGFATYAELSVDAKMVGSVAGIERLLAELYVPSHPAALREHAELEAFAREAGARTAGASDSGEPLALWDVGFWARRLREARFAYSDEDLKPYFPLPAVLDGLFALLGRLFGVSVVPRPEVSGWHADVTFYEVVEDVGEGRVLAGFFLDPYSRPAEKRGGAWMSELRGRSRLLAPAGEAVRTPIAYLVCNQSPPIGARPSLMTWGEVQTLFHEMGHGLQHMLTEVELGAVAGISGIEWDAVELPSQFMENWLRHPATLRSFARHVESGEPIPEALAARVLAAATFRAGSSFLRQIYFARLDLELHHRFVPGGARTIWEAQRAIAAMNTVLPPLPDDRFLCSFGHLFAGGYAAGYYSYKWAEVLSADAFSAFEEAGLDDAKAVAAVGRRFRETVLALGGSVPPAEVFRRFRAREPEVRALLAHHGLAAPA